MGSFHNMFKTKTHSEFTNIKKDKKELWKEKALETAKKIERTIIIFAVSAVSLALVFTYAAEKYVEWRVTHEWQVPTVWIGFIREIKNDNPAVSYALAETTAKTVKKTDMEIIEQYKLSPVLKTIYFLESTSGKSDSCKDQGTFNGYGYRQNTREHKCYDSFEEVTDKVNEWFEQRLADNGNNLIDAVCYYNKGIEGLETCDYSHNFMLVLTKNF